MVDAQKLITENLDIWSAAIKRKSAAGRGKRNKLELYGIKKLRELILDLAVRGLLVPQDPNDKPASVLLEKIAKEKARLVKEGKIKKQKVLPEISEDEKPFELPEGWSFIRWGEMAIWAIGSGFPKSAQGEVNQEILFSKVSDMNLPGNEKYIYSTINSISLKTAQRLKVKLHHSGTVIFPKIGGAIATNKRRILTRLTAIDNNCLGLVPTVGMHTDFLYLILHSVDLSEFQSGTSVPALSQSTLELIISALPPFIEQHRIVAKVDELMALCDQLEQQQSNSISAHETLVKTLLGALTTASEREGFNVAWSRIEEHFHTLFTTESSIEQLKQTILQLAVMGKLVPQDPNDEPASVLLGKIAKEKAKLIKEGKIKKQKVLPEISEDEKPFELPQTWECVNLSDVFALVTDGDHQAPPKSLDGIPFLVIGNLNTGKISLEGCRFVPGEYYEKLDWARKPLNGDLLYTVTGSYGIPIIVDIGDRFCVQRHVAIFKSTISTLQCYLALLLGSKYAFDYSTSIATGIAQKTVPLAGLRKMPVSLPPEAEQHRIVAKVDKLMVLCDTLKIHLNTAQTTQLQLADSLAEQAIG